MKNKMLFMNVISWAAQDRNKVIKMVADVLEQTPLPQADGMQQIWWDASGNRYWELIDTNRYTEPIERLAGAHKYLHLLHFERVPVVEWKDACEVFKRLKVI